MHLKPSHALMLRAIVVGVALSISLGISGSSWGRPGRPAQDVLSAHAFLHAVEASEVLAFIQFIDDGEVLMIQGLATGLDPEETYITLIYDNGAVSGGPNACTPTVFDPDDPEFLLNRMVVATWEVDEFGTGSLQAVNTNDGLDYVPLELFHAVSVRRVLGPPPAPGAPPPTELVACGRVATRGVK